MLSVDIEIMHISSYDWHSRGVIIWTSNLIYDNISFVFRFISYYGNFYLKFEINI